MEDEISCVSAWRHLTQWELGICYEFFREGSATEAKLLTNLKGLNEEQLAKTFAKLVLEGKMNTAKKLLDQQSNLGVFPPSQSTINELNGNTQTQGKPIHHCQWMTIRRLSTLLCFKQNLPLQMQP